MARTKGAKNKTGAEVKAQMLACYERLGGLKAYEAWANEHKSEFYRAYAQLAPKEISADVTYHDETSLTDAELGAIAAGGSVNSAEQTSESPESGELH